jgi:hypothetical protein
VILDTIFRFENFHLFSIVSTKIDSKNQTQTDRTITKTKMAVISHFSAFWKMAKTNTLNIKIQHQKQCKLFLRILFKMDEHHAVKFHPKVFLDEILPD